jgi:hypothetical protein
VFATVGGTLLTVERDDYRSIVLSFQKEMMRQKVEAISR